nr:uncharacterized protein LOC127483186 isoform X3 [Oryctolagus cuniculus]
MREHWFSQARRVYASRFQFFTDGNVRSISPKRFQIHGPSEVSAFCCCVHFCPDSSQKYSSQGAVLLEMLILEDNYWKYVGKAVFELSSWPSAEGKMEEKKSKIEAYLLKLWKDMSPLPCSVVHRGCPSTVLVIVENLLNKNSSTYKARTNQH